MCSAFYFLWGVKFIQLVCTMYHFKEVKNKQKSRIIPSLIYLQIKSGLLLGFYSSRDLLEWKTELLFCVVCHIVINNSEYLG